MTRLFITLLFSPLLAQSPPDLLLNKADLLIRNGKPADAETTTRDYLHDHPTSGEGHFLLGSILFLEKKATDSLAEYTEGAKYRVPSARDLTVVGSDYVLLNDFSDADKWFSKVVEWTPQDAHAWYNLGRTKYNENRFDEAIDDFKHVLQLDPGDVKAADNLGLSYGAIGRNEEAYAAYRQAIKLEENAKDNNSGPYFDWGSLLIENNRIAEALPLLMQALEISPDDFRVHRELGKVYRYQNDLTRAQAELEKAIELAPRNPELHFILAQIYRKQGQTDKARQETDRYTALK